MGSLLRWLWPAVLVAACKDYDSEDGSVTPAAPDAGNVADAGTDIDANVTTPTLDAAAPPSDGPSCPGCASNQCNANGGCFPLVFITPGKYGGSFGSLARGDEICSEVAGRPGRFVAWLSSDDKSAYDRLVAAAPGGLQRPVVDVNGAQVSPSLESMRNDKKLANPVVLAFDKTVVPTNDHVWTGTGAAGQSVTGNCADWTKTAATGVYGEVGAPGSAWTNAEKDPCTAINRLYCFEATP